MNKVLGLIFDGCQASGVVSAFDVFNVINTQWKQQRGDEELYSCQLVSETMAPVRCSNGVLLQPDFSFDDAPEANLILVPGVHHADSRGLIANLKRLEPVGRWLASRIEQGELVSANCSGVLLLAEQGVLDGREATTAWWLGELFRKRYPKVQHIADSLLVKTPKICTTGSMSANLGVMLQLAEDQVGRQLAQSAARTMLIDASQIQASPYIFLQDQSDHQDSLVLAVESQLQREISQKLDMESLARRHAVSVRTLSRRFKQANGISLSDYLQKLRLEHTKLLLESTSLSVEQIAERVGYSSQSSLRRLFQSTIGMSPKAYRQQKDTDA